MIVNVLKGKNRKLNGGERGNGSIFSFNLESRTTCPGATPVCLDNCYTLRNFFQMPNVVRSLREAKALADSPAFVELVVHQILHQDIRTVRIHSSGDFYNAAYVKKWRQIAERCPGTSFFAYTRSWRLESIKEELDKLAKLPNVSLWYSADRDAQPKKKDVPVDVRVAYMRDTESGQPRWGQDLVFRTAAVRNRNGVEKKVPARTGLPVLVCPEENGVTPNMSCEKCRICITK